LFGLLALLSRDNLLPKDTLVDAAEMTLSLSSDSSVELLLLEAAFDDKDHFFNCSSMNS